MTHQARIAFLGTPAEALPTLRLLATRHPIVLVVTQPDRPRGRSRRPVAPPVKDLAADLGLPVAQPERSSELAGVLNRAGGVDLGVVVAFGMLLRPEALAVPAHGFLNLHFSLLPRWRGAAPVEHALMAGDERTAASVMRLDEGLDTGPVLSVRSVRITPWDTSGSLRDTLSTRGAELMAETIDRLLTGGVRPVPQPAGGSTHARRLVAEDAHLDWSRPAPEIERRIRAMWPKPIAYSWLDGRRLRIHAAQATDRVLGPGMLVSLGDRLLCGTGTTALSLVTVQPEGKRPMPGPDWARGLRGDPGTLT